MFQNRKILELTKRHRGLVLILVAVCLLGGQIATISMLAEDEEKAIVEPYRLDMGGEGLSHEFGKVDMDVLEALENSTPEEQAQKEDEAKQAKAEKTKSKPESSDERQMAKTEQSDEKKVHPLKDKIARLSTSNPLNARCFGTADYVSNGDGSNAFKSIRGGVVQKLVEERDFSDKLASPESIVARMWLARERALNSEGGQTHLSALANYLIAAQRTLKDAHQHYGEEGLEWARTLLKTKADKRVFQQIKLRVPTKRYTRKLNQKMRLLTENTADFIPCTVRAEREFGGQMSAQLGQ